MCKKISAYLFLFCCFITAQAVQINTKGKSLGQASQALLDPLSGIKKTMVAISVIIGIAFLMGAVIQYMDHRKNPVQVTISKPIVYLILGIVFLTIPYATEISASAKVFL